MNAHVALRAFEDDHRAGAKASVTTPGVWGRRLYCRGDSLNLRRQRQTLGPVTH